MAALLNWVCIEMNVSTEQRKTKGMKKDCGNGTQNQLSLCISCNPSFSPRPQQQKLEVMSLDTLKTTKRAHTHRIHSSHPFLTQHGSHARNHCEKSAVIVNTFVVRETAFLFKRPSGCSTEASAWICDLSGFCLCGELRVRNSNLSYSFSCRKHCLNDCEMTQGPSKCSIQEKTWALKTMEGRMPSATRRKRSSSRGRFDPCHTELEVYTDAKIPSCRTW